MRYLIVDDDDSVVEILKMLVEQMGGEVTGIASNGVDALDELDFAKPDIVLVDLLMPRMDGITFVGKAKLKSPNVQFVMLSQVADKDMIARAYENGIEFYISKPVNGIEVKKVLQNVEDALTLQGTFSQMQNLLRGSAPAAAPPATAPTGSDACGEKVNAVLHSLGIGADAAAKEIRQVAQYIHTHPQEDNTVAELCAKFSENPKTMEQRIRRAAGAGLANLASRGIEDYGDEVFCEYSGTLYKFEQVRREMEFIRRGDGPRGKVSVRQFLYALAAMC